jgi:hypothetical protein
LRENHKAGEMANGKVGMLNQNEHYFSGPKTLNKSSLPGGRLREEMNGVEQFNRKL